MFVQRDTHRHTLQRHDSVAVTWEQGKIVHAPLAVMPPETGAVIPPVEGGDDEQEQREEE